MTNKDDVESLLRFPYDQLRPSEEFLKFSFSQPEWQNIIQKMKLDPEIQRVMPASENGIRNIATSMLVDQTGMKLITVPGNERELSWKQYLLHSQQHKSRIDPVEYQKLVARSKHNRVRSMNKKELLELGVVNTSRVETRTLSVAFDTVILVWQNGKYIPIEKPESDEEAHRNILRLAMGEPFLVSTITNVSNLVDHAKSVHSATILPARVVTNNRSERVDLINHWINLYRRIKCGENWPWKVTPAGPSLMHPEIQSYVEFVVGNSLEQNILPDDLTCMTGNPEYKNFAEGLVRKHGYRSIDELTISSRQKTGMLCAGYSDDGLRLAMDRYLKKTDSATTRNIITLRWASLMDELLSL